VRITLQAPISQHTVKERSAFTVTSKFYADTSDPWVLTAPTTVRYRIDCLSTGYPVRDWTTLTTGTSVSISIASADTAILDDTKKRERKLLTVMADNGLSTQYQESYEWNVLNLPSQY
jgi:hypothetical protein